jgi:Domain of unknown function (DUF4336)
MLKEFGHEIWTAHGPEVSVLGFHYPTRMAVIRLSDGNLFIWSPIQLTDSLRAEVDAVGRVRHIVAPNSLHHLFLPEWKRAYPGARLYAPPGLRKKRKDVVFDADLGTAPSPDWGEEIDQVPMRGNLITTEVVFFHYRSGTCRDRFQCLSVRGFTTQGTRRSTSCDEDWRHLGYRDLGASGKL